MTPSDTLPAVGSYTDAEPGPPSEGVHHEMTKLQRRVNLASMVAPLVAFIAIIPLGWVSWSDLAIFGIMYVPIGLGITVGFHRYFTHRAFKTSQPMRYALAVSGEMAVQGAVLDWVADHRKHHAFTDVPGDPHSPHLSGSWWRGLWHAHWGWLMNEQGRADWNRYAGDLAEDAGMRRISKLFPLFLGLGLVIPAGLGYLMEGGAIGALHGLVWGGFVRIFILNHVTWSINSLCHFHGKRRFDTKDESTNVWWLALFSLGEAWHHNHHAFPRSAEQGLRRWELDPSGAVIRLMERMGLVWDVVRISPERQQLKEVVL